MSGQHFIDPDSPVAAILDAIIEAAGDNFSVPYDSGTQPHDVVSANQETLIQYQMPGGSQLEGHADPAQGGSIGTAINNMLGLLSPAISSYALILPILGVIRGIIEILCCLMNPFCVVRATIRLFTKWIPPFISLFPPLAGVIILISTIKAIIAIVLFVLTEVIPTIQLIVNNIERLVELLSDPDLTEAQEEARREKLSSLLQTLIQKTGVLAVFRPLLDLIFSILRLVAGFPCRRGRNADTGLTGTAQTAAGLDGICCGEDICPEILSSREEAPNGTGVLVNSNFGDCAPLFVYQLFTGNSKVQELQQFQESFQDQLDCQLDEPLKTANPPGSTTDRSLIKVKISGRRGDSRSFIAPVLDIDDTTIKLVSPLAVIFRNQLVNYEIQPDYDMMVMQNVLSVGCHPDVRSAKDNIANKFPDLDKSVLDSNPEISGLLDDYDQVLGDYNSLLDDLGGCIDNLDANCANDVQDSILNLFNGFNDNLIANLNSIISRNTETSTSDFEVDKRLVKSDGKDFSTITVIPKDITGARLIKNVPNGVSTNVEIITDFGILDDNTFENSTGSIKARIKSLRPGTATITAKVNGELITDLSETTETIKSRQVRFTSESILPTRRKRSKQSTGTIVSTGTTSRKEPRN